MSSRLTRSLDCPACREATPHRMRFKKSGFDILSCSTCGLGRSVVQDFDPKAYYTADYFQGGHSDGYADYVGSEAVLRKEFRRLIDWTRERTGLRAGRLLDVGCAYGFLLMEARDDYEVTGVELAGDAVAFCRSRGLDARQGVVTPELLAERGPFDLIFMMDVIEHLDTPGEVLRLLAGALKPGGALVLSTGDFGAPLARVMGPAWRLMTPPQHLWFFTVDAIRGMGGAAGLKVEHVDHPGKVVPLSLVAYQLQRIVGLKPSPGRIGGSVGIPVNLFDAMRVVLRKP